MKTNITTDKEKIFTSKATQHGHLTTKHSSKHSPTK